MGSYKTLAKEFLSEYSRTLRKNKGLTQEEVAVQLRISGRAYGDLERGKYCFSTPSLLFLMLMLEDEEIRALLQNFHKYVDSSEMDELAR